MAAPAAEGARPETFEEAAAALRAAGAAGGACGSSAAPRSSAGDGRTRPSDVELTRRGLDRIVAHNAGD